VFLCVTLSAWFLTHTSQLIPDTSYLAQPYVAEKTLFVA